MATPRTLSDKIWNSHVIHSPLQEAARLAALAEAGHEDTGLLAERADLLYIDLHLVHEVTSAQAFEGLRLAGRNVRRPDLTLATADHNVPTVDRDRPWPDALSIQQVDVLGRNAKEFGCPLFRDRRPPPGNRPRHRAGAGPQPAGHDDRLRRQPHLNPRCPRRVAFGIGTSEVEHVLATQTLRQVRAQEHVRSG